MRKRFMSTRRIDIGDLTAVPVIPRLADHLEPLMNPLKMVAECIMDPAAAGKHLRQRTVQGQPLPTLAVR
jgi:hypothetical protein